MTDHSGAESVERVADDGNRDPSRLAIFLSGSPLNRA
jgi:hypothetical protein